MPFFNGKFATNIAKYCTHLDKKLGVTIRPQKAEITAENKSYLQMFDALELLDKAPLMQNIRILLLLAIYFPCFHFLCHFYFDFLQLKTSISSFGYLLCLPMEYHINSIYCLLKYYMMTAIYFFFKSTFMCYIKYLFF